MDNITEHNKQPWSAGPWTIQRDDSDTGQAAESWETTGYRIDAPGFTHIAYFWDAYTYSTNGNMIPILGAREAQANAQLCIAALDLYNAAAPIRNLMARAVGALDANGICGLADELRQHTKALEAALAKARGEEVQS